MKITGKVFGIDFDGTIVVHMFPSIGEELEYACMALKMLRSQGNRLILWTCRYDKTLQDAISWCEDRGVFFDAVNKNLPEAIMIKSPKIVADYYFDDRSYPKFQGWRSVIADFCS